MSDASRNQRPAETPKRGEAAWRAHREEIASRNDRARRVARAKRQLEYDKQVADERAMELRERAELAKRRP
jgi:hypothetical protein